MVGCLPGGRWDSFIRGKIIDRKMRNRGTTQFIISDAILYCSEMRDDDSNLDEREKKTWMN